MASLPKLLSLFIIFLSIPIHSQLDQLLYNGFEHTNLTINGVTKIQENGVLRLTNDTSRLMGHAFHPSPLRFKHSNNSSSVFSFSTCFAFAIVPEYPKLGGHGLAFTISPSKQLKAHPSQYLGLLNASDMGNFSNHLFAVEFDTVQDFEFGDINDNHVGIDINSLVSNASANATYIDQNGVKQGLLLKSGKTIQAWIDYDSVQKTINVTISPTSSKPKLPILSFDMDLSSILHEYMYVGFSASTGLLASSHYVFGWSFKMNGAARSFDLSKLASLPGPPKKHRDITIGAIISSVLLVILTLSAAFYLVKKIKNADVIESWELETGPHRYSYQELKKATKGFKEKELLGHGGFGRVYKGTLPHSKTQIAVKRISQQSKQGLREFVSEITTIGKLRHRNLVQLLGWCRCREDLLLVYEFMPNGSLEKLLFDQPEKILNWDERFKIIKGVASGLLYLHEGYEQVVIHRDVKASNVLLDGELNGKLGDFGLARLYEHGSNPGTTRVVGTLGYLAPELPRTGKANTASDVFAFGALLLEVVCGRRPIDQKAMPEELVLVDHVWDKWRLRSVLQVVDSKLANEYEENEVMMVLKLGIMCSNNSPSARPGMRLVVRYLEGEIVMPDVLRPPGGGYDDDSQGGMDGFDDFVHSFDTASFDTNRYGASMSTSPLSLLNLNGSHRGDTSTGTF